MPLPGEPKITEHAYERALDRIGLSKNAFYVWVKATYRDWIQVSSRYLQERGVTCDNGESQHFINPFTHSKSVALCVSGDGKWIKTLVAYSVPEPVTSLGMSTIKAC